jgi:hypothetical protein
MLRTIITFVFANILVGGIGLAMELSSLPPLPAQVPAGDWLLNPSAFQAGIYRTANSNEIALDNGLLRRVFRVAPNAATVALDNLMTGESELRSVRPEAMLTLNGREYPVGGLEGQPIHNYLLPEWVEKMTNNPAAFRCVGFDVGKTQPRFPWKPRTEWMANPAPWPPPGVSLTFRFAPPVSVLQGVTVSIHYELFDGLPVVSKWITVSNGTSAALRLSAFKSEVLALVETAPKVDAGTPREWRIYGSTNRPPRGLTEAPREFIDRFAQLFVVTDYAMGGDMEAQKDNPGVRWVHDPLYRTGIQYYGQFKPCLLECSPSIGPDITIAPGQTWESFRAFELLRDSTDLERRSLAECRMWRAVAPWAQEHPLYMHASSSKPDDVKLAINQCAEVGFDMVILTFGSGFNAESEKPEYISQMKELADYAHSKNITLGGYSLLASRGGPQQARVISQSTGETAGRHTGSRFGATPCLATDWGEGYFQHLRNMYEQAGLGVFENDGSYPGDCCAATNHSGHTGFEDSQWRQWERIRDFYRWCRSRGIYLTIPDWHFLNGSSQTAMGYVENNWSLPRAYQEIIERQNVWDGTWNKTPGMGWMHVPLTQYHGGGEAATIEPLKDHLDHYETRLANLFGAGVSAAYRGPRLYDTDETRAVVKRWVDFYHQQRAILDSDVIHLRRPDGRDWDGLLHVNPQLPTRGLAMLYNPLAEDIRRTVTLPLYYTGLTDNVRWRVGDGAWQTVGLDARQQAVIQIVIPARGRVAVFFQAP